ncbi:MAG: dephospho-CoA kinase [Lentisphaerae bacterium]|nr:dephospho-CoA kinase [Lentisphaerota bacterium]
MIAHAESAAGGLKMACLCITGGIACGKTAVGRCLAARGVTVIEADEVCHALLQPGREVHDRVVREFGPGILASTGAIDRQLLGKVVFHDRRLLGRLNELMHPPAREFIQRRLRELTGLAAVIIPLLYEVGWEADWETVVCVSASHELQRRRLAGRGLEPAAAAERLAAQWPVEVKMRRADHVIYNSGSMEALERQTLFLWQRWLVMQEKERNGRKETQ